MAHLTRTGALAGVIAAASLSFAPAHAADIGPAGTLGYATSIHAQFAPAQVEGAPGSPLGASTYDSAADTAEWRRCGWRGCWGGGWGRGWRGRRGVRGGDILAGVLVLGGIAAIASAASRDRRRDRDVVVIERDRQPQPRYDDRYDRRDDRRDERRSGPRSSGGSGLDNAVDICLEEIERDVRVDSVDNAAREPQGWVVSGTLFNGSGFVCEIDNNGRIADIDFGSFSSFDDGDGTRSARFEEAEPAEGQWSQQDYAAARRAVRDQPTRFVEVGEEPLVPLTSDRMPAYPGGPVPGETYED